jgi:ABC-type Na+ efflux pump permease subunit
VSTRLVLIARNAFRSIMSRGALYVWALGLLVMFFRATPQIVAAYRGPERMREFNLAGAVAGSLEVWAFICLGATIFLAGASMANEMTRKTIVTVMARPVRRWELLVGKWLGVVGFGVVSLGIGAALALGLSVYLGVEVDRLTLVILREAAAQSIVAMMLYAGIAVTLGSFGSWVMAGGIAVMLAFMPNLIDELKVMDESPKWKRVGVTLDWVVPDGYDSHYARMNKVPFPGRVPRPGAPAPPSPPPVTAWVQESTWDLHKALLENLAYGSVYFLAGIAAFSRRNIKLS